MAKAKKKLTQKITAKKSIAKQATSKKSSRGKAPSLQKELQNLFTNIWPEERDLFIRPERLKYVRQIVKPKGCVFCEAAETSSREEKHVLYRSKNAMVILNKYPYNNGHILILPLAHQGNMEDLSDDVFNEIQKILKASVKILKDVYQCGGLNIGVNLGAAAGAGIPEHLHYHVVPRWYGDTNFFPLIAKTKLVVETLETTYNHLKGPFADLERKFK